MLQFWKKFAPASMTDSSCELIDPQLSAEFVLEQLTSGFYWLKSQQDDWSHT